MNKTTFYHDFPQDIEKIKEFPSHVAWAEKGVSENVTLIKTADESWFLIAKEDRDIVLSCNISEVKTKEIKEWQVSELKGQEVDNLENKSLEEVWGFFVLHALNLPVNRHSEDELPQPEFAQRIKNKM